VVVNEDYPRTFSSVSVGTIEASATLYKLRLANWGKWNRTYSDLGRSDPFTLNCIIDESRIAETGLCRTCTRQLEYAVFGCRAPRYDVLMYLIWCKLLC
jgi:hypothetical protein